MLIWCRMHWLISSLVTQLHLSWFFLIPYITAHFNQHLIFIHVLNSRYIKSPVGALGSNNTHRIPSFGEISWMWSQSLVIPTTKNAALLAYTPSTDREKKIYLNRASIGEYSKIELEQSPYQPYGSDQSNVIKLDSHSSSCTERTPWHAPYCTCLEQTVRRKHI